MEICEEKCIHKDNVDSTMSQLPDLNVINNISEIFKSLSEPSRLKIVFALLHSELCVCDLAVVCNMSESAISHQLRILRTLRVVQNRREGKIVYYRLDDPHIRNLIQNSLIHIAGGL